VVPLGSGEGVLNASAGVTVSANDMLTCVPVPSVSNTPKVYDPAVVGTPLKTPPGLKFRPGGAGFGLKGVDCTLNV